MDLRRARPRVAFLFTGQGSQYAGMGADLYRAEPVFRDVIDRCATFLRARHDIDLVSLMTTTTVEADQLLARTRYTQPALYAVQCALTTLWRSWGVEADAVVGHSVGEFAAAWAAGVLDLEDGLALIAARGQAMEDGCAPGAMAAVLAPAETAEQLAAIAGVEIAAHNAPGQSVAAGSTEGITRLLDLCKSRGMSATPLNTTRAFHSSLMEPALPEIERPRPRHSSSSRRDSPWISNVTGLAITAAPDAAYWRKHARQPVRFAEGMASLDALGIDVFLEIGPDPVLLSLARRTATRSSRSSGCPAWTASTPRSCADGQDDGGTLHGRQTRSRRGDSSPRVASASTRPRIRSRASAIGFSLRFARGRALRRGLRRDKSVLQHALANAPALYRASSDFSR